MKEIELVNGGVVLVDDDVYDVLSRFRWRKNAYGHVVTTFAMHRVIAAANEGEIVDHINGRGTDNRRANLRKCTPQQNQRNTSKRRNNKSGFKGVHRAKRQVTKPWAASLNIGGKRLFLGYYAKPDEAARAVDTAAREHHGAFARLNFPDSMFSVAATEHSETQVEPYRQLKSEAVGEGIA